MSCLVAAACGGGSDASTTSEAAPVVSEPAATEPPATEAATTTTATPEPADTEPPATEPPATEPPTTDAPADTLPPEPVPTADELNAFAWTEVNEAASWEARSPTAISDHTRTLITEHAVGAAHPKRSLDSSRTAVQQA